MAPVLPFALELPGRGDGSLVRTLHAQLRAAILDGRLPVDVVLPSAADIAPAHRAIAFSGSVQ